MLRNLPHLTTMDDMDFPPNDWNCRCGGEYYERYDPKKMPRKHSYSERFKVINVEGLAVTVYVTDDLTDEELAEHFCTALNKENYEYCEALAAEAAHRSIELKII